MCKQLTEMRGLVQRINRAVFLGCIQEFLQGGDEAKLQRRMQTFNGHKNDVKSWYYALYSRIAAVPVTEMRKKGKAEICRQEMIKMADGIVAQLGDSWTWVPQVLRNMGEFISAMAATDATETINTFQQFQLLKQYVRQKNSGEKFALNAVKDELLSVGMKHAAEEQLFSGDGDVKLRVEKLLTDAINHLACNSDCTAVKRPVLFYFTGLLLDPSLRYRLTPISGFMLNFVGLSIKSAHNFLIRECPAYTELNKSLETPFKDDIPNTIEERNRYFATFWLNLESQNKYLQKKLASGSIVFQSNFQTDGKQIHVVYIDMKRPKNPNGLWFNCYLFKI